MLAIQNTNKGSTQLSSKVPPNRWEAWYNVFFHEGLVRAQGAWMGCQTQYDCSLNEMKEDLAKEG